MRSTSDRVALVSKKARSMRRRRDRRINSLLIAVSGVASIVLVALIVGIPDSGYGSANGLYGALLRYGNAGSYVMVALCSFILAATLTIVCFKLLERSRHTGGNKNHKDGNHV